MPKNIEVKVKVADMDALTARARALPGVQDRGVLRQIDTYFAAPAGRRLKLREQDPGGAELIGYARPDIQGLRTCDYRLWKVADAAGLKETLALGLGVVKRVVKARHLFLHGRTRIHLDRVESLGDFMELEVVLQAHDTDAGGEAEAEDLLRALGLDRAPRIAGSYLEL